MLSPDDCTEIFFQCLGVKGASTGLTLRFSTPAQVEAYCRRFPTLDRIAQGLDYDERYHYLVAHVPGEAHAEAHWSQEEGPWKGLLYHYGVRVMDEGVLELAASPLYQRLVKRLGEAPLVRRYRSFEWLGKGVLGKELEGDLDEHLWVDRRHTALFRNSVHKGKTYGVLECWDSEFLQTHHSSVY